MERRRREALGDGSVSLWRCSGDEDILARGGDALANRRNLLRCLAWAEYHFGEPLPHGSVVVDAGKPEIFERCLAQIL
jgi:hypothetical protein